MAEGTDYLALVFTDTPCRDDECEGIAEQEKDGDHLYWICNECGFEFGYTKAPAVLTNSLGEEGTCQMGLTPGQRDTLEVMASGSPSAVPPQPVSVSIGRKSR